VSWVIAITHTSGFHYAEEARASYNEVRISPITTPTQTVLESTVEVRPTADVLRYWDYWGSLVHAFDVHEAHTDLQVVGRSIVETTVPGPPDRTTTWDQLAAPAVADRFVEHLAGTAYAPPDPELAAIAAELRAGRTPVEAVEAVLGWMADAMSYVPGATAVTTSAVEAWHQRRGVCQDYAHLASVALRAMGIPTRYVSGYLHPRTDAPIGIPAAGESHAWIEAWLGGWWGVDPTNGIPAGERHVLVARGRDYADVPPIKGVYVGGAAERLGVTVELTRVA
jgi:transglutaminase-like putative cysteine protease